MPRALLLGVLGLAVGAPAAPAAVDVGDVTVVERNEDGVVASFTVTRTAGILAGNATIAFSTADGSARSPDDYVAAAGSLSFGPLLLGGVQAQQVLVAIKGDSLDEPAETFRLRLSGSAEIGDGEGLATIVDDDPPPVVSVSDAPAAAEAGTATFNVALSSPSGHDVSVAFTTADGSAAEGQDYTARSGTLAIPAGATTAALDVALLADDADEPDESFELRIGSPASATVGRATARATIVDDDDPAPGPQASAPGADASAGAAVPAPGTTSAAPRLGLSSPRLRRPSIVLVTVSCPRQATRCRGRVTIFSRANPRSKIKALRSERRLGRRSFTLASGATRTLTMALSRADRVLLTRTGRMLVRAYAVSTDGSGRSGVRRVTGTLIARTSHS